jgi:hypothetical protein
MQVTYRIDNATAYTPGTVTFLPSGKVGSSSPPGFLNDTNAILAPTIASMSQTAAAANIPNFDFWELMNWMFVSQYWLLLLDFGQIAPSTFNYDSQGTRLDYGPVRYSPEYNIFHNAALFDQYNSYLRQTILPLFGYSSFPDFLPLNDSNRMNATTASLQMLYTCTDLQLKDSTGLVISIIVADYGMIASLSTVILILLALWLRKRRIFHCPRILIVSASTCGRCGETIWDYTY